MSLPEIADREVWVYILKEAERWRKRRSYRKPVSEAEYYARVSREIDDYLDQLPKMDS